MEAKTGFLRQAKNPADLGPVIGIYAASHFIEIRSARAPTGQISQSAKLVNKGCRQSE
jgi:hypothetical protein